MRVDARAPTGVGPRDTGAVARRKSAADFNAAALVFYRLFESMYLWTFVTSRGRSAACAESAAVLIAGVLAFAPAFALPPAAAAQEAGSRYVLLIGGLGGEPTYTERFGEYLNSTRSVFVDRYGVPSDQVNVLAEPALANRTFVDDVSTAENIRAALVRLAGAATPDDHVYVILFGHGSYDGAHAQLNIPRRDLTDADYASLLDDVDAGRIIVINTSSASGPFAERLSGPDRIILAATATGTQRDETLFPRLLVESLRSPDADLDKSGGLSVLELFRYTAQEVARSFEATGHLATEHAVIDDDGDGEPTRFDRLDDGKDGALAAITYIRPPDALASIREADRPLLREREALQREIADLKSRKATMPEDAYYSALQGMLITLARLNERLESDQ